MPTIPVSAELLADLHDGLFLPSVPIVVNLIDVESVVVSRSDWDYFEAIRAGEDELAVGWACPGPGGSPVEARIGILVTRGNADVLGLVLLGSFLWSNSQRQSNAMLELLKRLEHDRS
jgi:hypothetical protein